MQREIFGNKLPPIEESHVGDRFYDMDEDKHYVFDDGKWILKEQEDGGNEVIFEITNVNTTTAGHAVRINSADINTTWSELTSAITNGKKVVLRAIMGSSSTATIFESPLSLISVHNGEITRVSVGGAFEYNFLPAMTELSLCEDDIEENVIDIRGYVIPLLTD